MNVDPARRLGPESVEGIVEALSNRGLTLREADFRGGFGSWYFIMRGDRACIRVAFDGRDDFLYYDRWTGGNDYEVSQRHQTHEWETLLALNPTEAPAESWTPQVIIDTMALYALGV